MRRGFNAALCCRSGGQKSSTIVPLRDVSASVAAEAIRAASGEQLPSILGSPSISLIMFPLPSSSQSPCGASSASFTPIRRSRFLQVGNWGIRGWGWSVLDAFRNEDDPQVTLGQALITDEDSICAFQLQLPKPALVEVYAGVIQDDEGDEKYRIAAVVDVTEQENAKTDLHVESVRGAGTRITIGFQLCDAQGGVVGSRF